MSTDTYVSQSVWQGVSLSNAHQTVTSSNLGSFDDAFRGKLITGEILSNPEEIEELNQSRAQAERGEVRWLAEDETGDEESQLAE